MLTVIPSSAYGRLGAVLSALIVCASVIGLTMHKDFYAGIKRRDFYVFYTNLSNLAVLVYFSLIAPWLYARSSLRRLIPHAEFSVMMSIMLTFCVFHTLIFPAVSAAAAHAVRTRAFYIVLADNIIVHYAVPLLVFTYWLLCAPGKQYLGMGDAFVWTLFPVMYLVFVFLRAKHRGVIEETGSPYPYPFLDVGVLGARRVVSVCAALYTACAGTGLAVIAIIRAAIAIWGSGHALVLI